jgi:hypothetical protein
VTALQQSEFDAENDQLLLRQDVERLCCINLDGHVIYRYDISGCLGLAVDQQGHVYINHSPMFILLSFVLLVVLINCMDPSSGRVTTALSVHGTTVIITLESVSILFPLFQYRMLFCVK